MLPYAVDAPRYESAVHSAARAWNRARVGIRFKRVPLERARLVIRAGRSRGAGVTGCVGENGRAMLGWPGAHYTYSTIGLTHACRSARARRLVAMHELGHALGLDHDDSRCAVMNSAIRVRVVMPRRCRGRSVAKRLRRGLLLRDDIRGARSLYRLPPPVESPAVARFQPEHGRPAAGQPVTFSAGLRNERLDYQWDFDDPESGDANTATGLDAEHAFRRPGAYEVRLSVIDGDAVIAARSRRIWVSGEP